MQTVSEVKICVTGDVTVGIVNKIRIEHVEGVHMLLGNDIACGQVDVLCCVKSL